jgi:hypothetical protein
MAIIENFAELSEQELKAFAESLVKTLNTENTFSDDFEFVIRSVEADDFTGGLAIELSTEGDVVRLERGATWTCGAGRDDDPSDIPDDPEFDDDILEDAKDAFKTLSAEIEGYTITLIVADVDEEDIVDVEVRNVSEEDSGIGDYEYFGYRGYDSHPYCSVDGTLTQECTIYFGLDVVATDAVSADKLEADEADKED